MTENTCYSHVSLRENIKIGSVGQALPLCDVKLSEKKEILIKHDALMDGYYKDEEQTHETIKDGWLYTGDEGEIDSDGFLKITDKAFTKTGIILQCHNKAEIADITIIKVKPPKAKIKVPPELVISKGALGALSAKYPNTKAVP